MPNALDNAQPIPMHRRCTLHYLIHLYCGNCSAHCLQLTTNVFKVNIIASYHRGVDSHRVYQWRQANKHTRIFAHPHRDYTTIVSWASAHFRVSSHTGITCILHLKGLMQQLLYKCMEIMSWVSAHACGPKLPYIFNAPINDNPHSATPPLPPPGWVREQWGFDQVLCRKPHPWGTAQCQYTCMQVPILLQGIHRGYELDVYNNYALRSIPPPMAQTLHVSIS